MHVRTYVLYQIVKYQTTSQTSCLQDNQQRKAVHRTKTTWFTRMDTMCTTMTNENISKIPPYECTYVHMHVRNVRMYVC